MTYTFSVAGSFTFAQLRELPETRIAQVIEVVRLRDPAVSTLEQAVEALRRELGIDDADEALALYRIEPGYELWVYLREAGIVFVAESGDWTPVYCQQCYFWSVDPDDAAAVQFATELNACARW